MLFLTDAAAAAAADVAAVAAVAAPAAADFAAGAARCGCNAHQDAAGAPFQSSLICLGCHIRTMARGCIRTQSYIFDTDSAPHAFLHMNTPAHTHNITAAAAAVAAAAADAAVAAVATIAESASVA